MYTIALISLTLFGFVATAPQSCTDDSQCDKTQCCQILSEFMIVSRRDVGLLQPKLTRAGTCQPYSYEGDNCDSFAKPNGYCSCAPGLTCRGKEVFIGTPSPMPTLTVMGPAPAVHKRSMIPPRPGYQWEYKCRKI